MFHNIICQANTNIKDIIHHDRLAINEEDLALYLQ